MTLEYNCFMKSPRYAYGVGTILIAAVVVGMVGAAWWYKTLKESADTHSSTIDQNAVPSEDANSAGQASVNGNAIGNLKVPGNLRVLYEYRRFKPETTKVYTAKLDGSGKEIAPVDIDSLYSYKYTYYYDRSFFIQNYLHKELRIIPKTNLGSKATFVSVDGAATYLGSYLPISDSQIIYVESRGIELGQHEFGGPRETNIYLINTDGTEKKLIHTYTHSQDTGLDLKAFNETTSEVYWTEGGGGGCSGNFTALNIATGELKKVPTSISDEDVCSLVFSRDKMTGYYREGPKTIIAYDFSSNQKRTLYVAPDGRDSVGNQTYIRGPLLSPDYKWLAYSERLEPSDKEITKLINLGDGKIVTLLDDNRLYNVGPSSWSPDSRYLWLETGCFGCGREQGYDNEGEYYILDTATKTISRVFKGESGTYSEGGEGVRINEHLFLLGWIEDGN